MEHNKEKRCCVVQYFFLQAFPSKQSWSSTLLQFTYKIGNFNNNKKWFADTAILTLDSFDSYFYSDWRWFAIIVGMSKLEMEWCQNSAMIKKKRMLRWFRGICRQFAVGEDCNKDQITLSILNKRISFILWCMNQWVLQAKVDQLKKFL